MAEAPDRVDIHVGQALRARRQAIGQSQTALAEALGVSFQQVQKYEKASNRVSASVLYHAAKAQGVKPSHYFEGFDDLSETDISDDAKAATAWLESSQARSLAEVWIKISKVAQKALLEFVRYTATRS